MALVEASPVGEPTGREPPFMGERAGGPPEAPIAPQGKKTAGLGCSMGDVLMMRGGQPQVLVIAVAIVVADIAPILALGIRKRLQTCELLGRLALPRPMSIVSGAI